MFDGAVAFNQDIGGWDTGKFTNMRSMISEASAFKQDIGDWNTNAVTTMETMFFGQSGYKRLGYGKGYQHVGHVYERLGLQPRHC